VSHPVARAALLLFIALFIAMFYGATPLKEALVTVAKYKSLAFIPIFIFLLSNEMLRRRARYAFLLAMAVTLAVSLLIGLKILPVMPWMNHWTVQDNPAIFHSHITQNNMMAFAVFLSLLEWRDAITRAKRYAWFGFALLGIFNVVFMVQGRTGYLLLVVLLGWFIWRTLVHHLNRQGKRLGWLYGTIAVIGFVLVILMAYQTSSRLHDRVKKVVSEYMEWTPNHANGSSLGERLDFYSNTLQIVRKHPLTGVGTGGFAVAFAQQTEGTEVMKTHNPHNEFLMISTQTGLIGLALLILLFYTHWRYAPLLPTSLEQDAARGLLLAYVVNCSLNSALMDHADGLFFAFMTSALFANLKVGSKT
jgi:O-antigen ligase